MNTPWRRALLSAPAGGGGHCLFESRYPKQNYRPQILCYHIPLSPSLFVYSPCFLRHQRIVYCHHCCFCGLPKKKASFHLSLYNLYSVIKTLIIAFLGLDKPKLILLPPQSRPSSFVCSTTLKATASEVCFAVGTQN